MTFRAYLGPGIVGPKPRDAGIVCDGCGYFLRVGRNRLPPQWFLDGKAPPKWMKTIHWGADIETDIRRDYCPACKEKVQP
jgi:hypothetical protein